MDIRIDDQLQSSIRGFNIQKAVTKLLRIVPKEHLMGIDKIVIAGQMKKREVSGTYRKGGGSEATVIEISFKSVYKKMPKFLFRFPFIPKFMLADALYHEIGHHFERNLSHGIKKREREKYADDYGKKMLKKAFFGWLILLYPLKPLVNYLNKKVQEKDSKRSYPIY